jgi:hypothetical protein
MDKGKIEGQGNFKTLSETSEKFSVLMNEHGVFEKEEGEKKEGKKKEEGEADKKVTTVRFLPPSLFLPLPAFSFLFLPLFLPDPSLPPLL